jgi:hypothetical protein
LRVEERVDFRDRHSLPCLARPHNIVAGCDLAFPEDAKIEPRPSARCQQGGHAGLVHSNADAIAGYPRLRDFEDCAANLKTVADAHVMVGQSFDGEVLAKLSVDEIGSLQLFLPVTIRFDLVDEDGALFASVPGQIALTVSVQIQPADPAAAKHWILPNPGVHGPPFPLDVARQSDVHR